MRRRQLEGGMQPADQCGDLCPRNPGARPAAGCTQQFGHSSDVFRSIDCERLRRASRLAQRPRPAHCACGEAASSPTTSCRTRRLQCLDPLLVRNLQQNFGLRGALTASAHATSRDMSAGNWRRRCIQPGQPSRSAGCSCGLFLRVRTVCTSRLREEAKEVLWVSGARKAECFRLA